MKINKIFAFFIIALFSQTIFGYCANGNSACVNSSTMRICENNEWIERHCDVGCIASKCKLCKDGEMICNDYEYYSICNNGQWSTAVSCPQNSICFDGACNIRGSEIIDCRRINDTRCYKQKNNISVMQVCNESKMWQVTSTCNTECYGDSNCKECDYQNVESECLSDISFKHCLSNYTWSGPIFCMSNYRCKSGKCVEIESMCKDGAERCVNNSVYRCFANEGWRLIKNCYSHSCTNWINQKRIERAECQDFQKRCFEWGDDVFLNYTTHVEKDEQGRERTCTNSTYVKKCIDYRGGYPNATQVYSYKYACGEMHHYVIQNFTKKNITHAKL